MKPKNSKNAQATARRSLSVGEPSDEELAAIAAAEVPLEYSYLDEELPPPPYVCHESILGDHEQRLPEGGPMRGKSGVTSDFDGPEPETEKPINKGNRP